MYNFSVFCTTAPTSYNSVIEFVADFDNYIVQPVLINFYDLSHNNNHYSSVLATLRFPSYNKNQNS